jgi:hypothetical protein
LKPIRAFRGIKQYGPPPQPYGIGIAIAVAIQKCVLGTVFGGNGKPVTAMQNLPRASTNLLEHAT